MSGVEYIKENLSQHPQCVHGPTFLMARNTAKGLRRFFTCSACRDRKDCTFFLWEDDIAKVNTDKGKEIIRLKQLSYIEDIKHEELFKTLKKIRRLPEEKRNYCLTCNKFIIDKEHDSSHNISVGITDKQLNFPSTFLKPLENDKTEAQYLFSESSVITTINMLKDLEITNVLCIGAPRIHEYIQEECDDMKSILLDIDKRYLNFFGPKEFVWYNLFNNHFFIPDSKKHYMDFLKLDDGCKTVIVTDPPFGGRLEPVSQTIYAIEEEYKKLNSTTRNLPVLLYFPYFMEQHIKNHLPDFEMADYKVNYDNHSLFATGEKTRKHGSPVRIFTNLDIGDLDFKGDGYRYCDFCERCVYEENEHCFSCSACTSKDGRTYVHCKFCNKCVKPTWKHCGKCRRCAQPDHKCGEENFSQSCFHCHERGHKKSECPKVDVSELKRKRKAQGNKNKKIKM